MEESSEELFHGDGSPSEILSTDRTVELLHLAGAGEAGEVAGDALEDLGWGLEGLVADRALRAGNNLGLGRQLGEVTVELLVLSPQGLHHLVLSQEGVHLLLVILHHLLPLLLLALEQSDGRLLVLLLQLRLLQVLPVED